MASKYESAIVPDKSVVQGGNEKFIYFKQRAFIAASAGLNLPLPYFLVKKVSKSSQIS